MQSKRSREWSPDDEASSTSKQKRHREGRSRHKDASSNNVTVHKRRGGKSLPAEDTQFLAADASSARPKSKLRMQERSRRLQEFYADNSQSIIELGVDGLALEDKGVPVSVKGQKGKSRAR
jgi:hypothetical protein